MTDPKPPVLPDDPSANEAALRKGEEALRDDAPQRLSLEERERMRQILGVDPGGDVAIHTGPAASAAATAMEAKAFTLGGKDIYFRKGAFQPDSIEGQALLAHELTHVIEDVTGASREEGMSEGEQSSSENRAERSEQAAREAVSQVQEMKLDTVQKERLVEKVVKILERNQRRDQERRGSR